MTMKHRRVTALPDALEAETTYYVLQGDGSCLIYVVGDDYTVAFVNAKGDTGDNIELQKTATHLQWRNVGGSTWTNLVALADITGPKGDTGEAYVNIDGGSPSSNYGGIESINGGGA